MVCLVIHIPCYALPGSDCGCKRGHLSVTSVQDMVAQPTIAQKCRLLNNLADLEGKVNPALHLTDRMCPQDHACCSSHSIFAVNVTVL